MEFARNKAKSETANAHQRHSLSRGEATSPCIQTAAIIVSLAWQNAQ
jgi:hypothetical protein